MLAIAGRVADGVIIQLADPEIVEWIVGQVRRGAEEAGRDPSEVKVMCCAPAHVCDDIADSCEQVRWFPAMVSNHVFDVLSKHDAADLPPALTEYVSRMKREAYDYSEHSRVGAKHGEQITDETCERFCILGPPEAHVEKLRRLEAAGVDQWNIYLMTHGQEETLAAYGEQIIPALAAEAVPLQPAADLVLCPQLHQPPRRELRRLAPPAPVGPHRVEEQARGGSPRLAVAGLPELGPRADPARRPVPQPAHAQGERQVQPDDRLRLVEDEQSRASHVVAVGDPAVRGPASAISTFARSSSGVASCQFGPWWSASSSTWGTPSRSASRPASVVFPEQLPPMT